MSEPNGGQATGGAVKSAERTLAILEALSFIGRPVQFSELQADLGYPRSSLHGLLNTLEAAKWVERDPATQAYTLGLRAWEVGIGFRRVHGLTSVARPVMQRVSDTLGETVQLAVLDGSEAVYLEKVDGRHPLRLDSEVGARLAAHATGVGKTLLAFLDDDQLDRLLASTPLDKFTPNTISDPHELLQELHRIRDRGFARDNEERTLGAACIAVPIRDREGQVCAAMSVSAPVVRFGSKEQRAALAELNRAAEEVGHRLV